MDSVIISNDRIEGLVEPKHGLTIVSIKLEGDIYTVDRQLYRHEILNIEALEELFKEEKQ